MKLDKILFTLCISWFVFLCLLHYCSQRPLWLDENFILGNIKSLNFAQILGPLKNNQAFPRVYLIVIKGLSQKFGDSTFVFRLFPLLSMLTAFFIWAKIYRKRFSTKWLSLLALFSFSSSYYLSYYAAELKHYSMDVLVVAIFCLYLTHQKQYIDKAPSKNFIKATLILPFTVLLSYSSFFVFWIVIYNFLFLLKKNAKILPVFIIYTFTCFLLIAFVYFFDLRYTLAARGLFSYWKDYFISIDSPYYFIKSFGEGVKRLTVWWFGNGRIFRRIATVFIPFFVFSLFGYGIKSLKKDKFRLFSVDTIGLIIFVEMFVLGIMKKYPFTGERITLFFSPFVFYFLVKSINHFKKNKPLHSGLNVFYIVFLLACSLNSLLMYLRLYN